MTEANTATKPTPPSDATARAIAVVRYQIRDVERAIKFYTEVLDFSRDAAATDSGAADAAGAGGTPGNGGSGGRQEPGTGGTAGSGGASGIGGNAAGGAGGPETGAAAHPVAVPPAARQVRTRGAAAQPVARASSDARQRATSSCSGLS